MELSRSLLRSAGICCLGLFTLSTAIQAKGKKAKLDSEYPGDQIVIVGHVSLRNGVVTRLLATQHNGDSYLYAERDPGGDITLIDVTKASHPSVLREMSDLPKEASGAVLAVAGTAALVAEESNASSTPMPRKLRIMDFSDPQYPKIAREFDGVTAIS